MADAGNQPSGEQPKSESGGTSLLGADAKKTGKQVDAGVEGVVGGALMTVVVRNEFYRDGFRNLIKITFAEAVIIVVLVITFIAYMDNSRARNHYFATTADGRIMQVVPLDKPYMSEPALVSWAAQAATETMTFGYSDYEQRLQNSSRHFTDTGYKNFRAALKQSRILESIQALQQVVSAELRGAPSVKSAMCAGGKYCWEVKLPLKVTYQSSAGSRIDNTEVTLVIVRMFQVDNPDGVGIEQWILTQPDAGTGSNG